MEPWGFEPQIPPCHGGVIPFHYGPGISFSFAAVPQKEAAGMEKSIPRRPGVNRHRVREGLSGGYPAAASDSAGSRVPGVGCN